MSQDESGRGVSQLCCFSHSKYILHNSFIDFVTDDMISRIFVSCQLCCKSFLLLEPLHPFCLDHCDNPLVGKQANRSVANIVFGSLNKSSNTTCNVLLLMTYFTPTF